MNFLKWFKKKEEGEASSAPSKHYLTGKEARAIAKANNKEMRRLEKAKRRKLPPSAYVTEMKDEGNIPELCHIVHDN